MAEMDLLTIIKSVPFLIEELGKALKDLESHEDTSIDKGLLEDIERHFRDLEASAVNKSLELESREKAFKEQESDAHLLIASREADIAAREQNLWDQLQELKDAAVSAIAAARGDHQLASLEHTDVEDSKDIEELAAVRAVVRCIRDYKLEAEYPLDPLQRRVGQLEKAISNDRSKSSDKRRHSGSARHQQFKKPRPSGGTHGSTRPANVPSRQPPSVLVERVAAYNPSRPVPSGLVERATYAGLSDKYTHLSASYDYQAPSQAAYPQQSYEQRSYYYPADDGTTATSYTPSLPYSYGNYAGSGMPVADEIITANSYTTDLLASSYGNYVPTTHQSYVPKE